MKLRDGAFYLDVTLGVGTGFKQWHQATVDNIILGTEVGYKMVDTAMYYNNEDAVGEAVKKLIDEKKLKREDIMIQTKIIGHTVSYQQVKNIILRLTLPDEFLISSRLWKLLTSV